MFRRRRIRFQAEHRRGSNRRNESGQEKRHHELLGELQAAGDYDDARDDQETVAVDAD